MSDALHRYVMLLKLTDQGKESLADPVAFMHMIEDSWAQLEGGHAEVYLMLGRHDFVVIGTAQNPRDVVALAVSASWSGSVDGETSEIHDTDAVASATVVIPHIKPTGHFTIELPPAPQQD